MADTWQDLYAALWQRAEDYGIQIEQRPLDPEIPGKFDGRSITMNAEYDRQQCCHYLAHSIGSIVCWSVEPEESHRTFDELHAAEADRQAQPQRFEQAIDRFRAFEEQASRYAVWLLDDLGFGAVIPDYTNFARADMEAIISFHRNGVAPVWRDFFAQWNVNVAQGKQPVLPYQPLPIPPFEPRPIRTQQIVQEVDGQP